MWLNVRTGLTRTEVLNAPPHTLHWIFDSSGQARVATSQYKGRSAIFWRAPGQTAWRQLAEGDSLKMPFLPLAVDDSGTLYVTYSEGDKG